MGPETPSPEASTSGSSDPGGRSYFKIVVTILAAFGILTAVGTRAVETVFSSAGKKLNPEKPVLIGVREDPQGGGDGFALARRSAEGLDAALKGERDCQRLFAAAKRAGAVDIGIVKEALVLEGGTSRDLSIVDMHAKILKREPALDGAHISCESAGAAGAIGVLFNLDEARPMARKLVVSLPNNQSWRKFHPTGDGGSYYDGPYFEQGNIVRLVKGEIQPFLLVGITTDDYVEWEVEADVIIDGEAQTITINNDGEPFRVTGSIPKQTGYGRYYEWQWYEQPQRMWIDDHPPTLVGS
jgi:hypothetical protein